MSINQVSGVPVKHPGNMMLVHLDNTNVGCNVVETQATQFKGHDIIHCINGVDVFSIQRVVQNDQTSRAMNKVRQSLGVHILVPPWRKGAVDGPIKILNSTVKNTNDAQRTYCIGNEDQLPLWRGHYSSLAMKE